MAEYNWWSIYLSKITGKYVVLQVHSFDEKIYEQDDYLFDKIDEQDDLLFYHESSALVWLNTNFTDELIDDKYRI